MEPVELIDSLIDFKELAHIIVEAGNPGSAMWSSRPRKRPREELMLLAKSKRLVLSKFPPCSGNVNLLFC